MTRADQWFENGAAGEGRDRGAIARCLLGEIVRRANAAGAGHDLDRHVRPAGDVASEMARKQPRIKVDPAAGSARHINCDRTIDVFLRAGGRTCRESAQDAQTAKRREAKPLH